MLCGTRPLRARRTITPVEPKEEPVLDLKQTCLREGCNKKFKSLQCLRLHLLNVHDESKKATCPQCGLVVKGKRNLQKHIDRIHLKLKNFFCDICGYGVTFKNNLSEHMLRHIEKEHRTTYSCDKCLFKTAYKKSLKTHKKYLHPDPESTHLNQVFSCHCGKEFKYKSAWSTHMKEVHKIIKKKEPVVRSKLSCRVEGCNKSFGSAANLRAHFSNVHDESKKVMCTQCGLVVKGNGGLRKHINRVHLKVKNFFCDICGHGAFFKNNMSEHMLRDTNQEKKHGCDQCSFKTANKGSLRTHKMYQHPTAQSNEAFSCTCGKQCRSQQLLKSHIRQVHEKIKNFKCNL